MCRAAHQTECVRAACTAHAVQADIMHVWQQDGGQQWAVGQAGVEGAGVDGGGEGTPYTPHVPMTPPFTFSKMHG